MLLRCFAVLCVNLLKHETTITTCVIHVEGLTSTLMAAYGDSKVPWPRSFAHFVLRSLLPAPECAFQSHLPFQLLTVCLWTQHSALCNGEDFSSSFQVYKLQAGFFFCVELGKNCISFPAMKVCSGWLLYVPLPRLPLTHICTLPQLSLTPETGDTLSQSRLFFFSFSSSTGALL